MPFRSILRDLLTAVDGSIGAMFLDYEGESVSILGDCAIDDLRIIGAYQGIFLGQLRKICDDIGTGEPARLKIEFVNARILTYVLKEGYYLVLIIRPGSNEGVAWWHLEHCHARLMAEI